MPLCKTAATTFFLLILSTLSTSAQQVTGVWKGRIDKKKVEVKIIQKGDSLTGTSYYYESPSHYRRYSIKGYFDQQNNSVVWWDDQLLQDKGNVGKTALLSVADFNCPGGGNMYLDGKAAPISDPQDIKGPVDLTKTGSTSFPDEWDYVIDNYTVGTNDPDIIDSVSLIAWQPHTTVTPTTATIKETPIVPAPPSRDMVRIPPPPEVKKPEPPATQAPQTIEQKFTSRKKIFAKEIPLEGDSIELRFYDNAEIDGDSISLFLNDKMLFQHIRLSDKAYTIRLPVKDLNDSNELIMVAENLGTIPPNTSYMVAIMGDKRYDAKLASTENSSAMIRLKK
ncbi:MAG TPA: hypothetical protein VHK91_06650 [Flavisolibacter sp.]|jgi:hypothetical protein|nr:hypothetical protein [Flavisolibacter sp.]